MPLSICYIYIHISLFIFTVKERKAKGELPQTVITVLEQELEKIIGNKDAQTLNEEFLTRNSNSVLHRAAGKYIYSLMYTLENHLKNILERYMTTKRFLTKINFEHR